MASSRVKSKSLEGLRNLSYSRFNEDEELDESKPIPQTPDGFVYYVGATSGGEFQSEDEAKNWADAQPWVPRVPQPNLGSIPRI